MIDRFLRLVIPKMYHGYGNPPTFLVNMSDYGVDINGPARIYLHKTISDEHLASRFFEWALARTV